MTEPRERNLGPQPLGDILARQGLKAHDLVAASATPISHKLIARAVKGRRLTPHSQALVRDALNRAAGAAYGIGELFTYP